jgi:hypothetical protein
MTRVDVRSCDEELTMQEASDLLGSLVGLYERKGLPKKDDRSITKDQFDRAINSIREQLITAGGTDKQTTKTVAQKEAEPARVSRFRVEVEAVEKTAKQLKKEAADKELDELEELGSAEEQLEAEADELLKEADLKEELQPVVSFNGRKRS